MPDHVLVPIDTSDSSDAALEFALSEHSDARITALHVIDPTDLHGTVSLEAGAPETYDEFRVQQREFADQILDDAAGRADEHGVDIETAQMIGSVPRSIIEFAEENGADHIVLGSHGRTGASRILLGSVAERVARRSPIPVTIVK